MELRPHPGHHRYHFRFAKTALGEEGLKAIGSAFSNKLNLQRVKLKYLVYTHKLFCYVIRPCGNHPRCRKRDVRTFLRLIQRNIGVISKHQEV